MAIPTIITTTSVQSWVTGQAFEFALGAQNEPTQWLVDKLPTGLALEALPTGYACTGVAATLVLTASGHPFANGDRVFFREKSGGNNLNVNQVYFVRDVSSSTFKLAASFGGAVASFATDISASVISKVQTGRVTGTPTVPGVTTASFVAMNNDGASAVVAVTFGIGRGSGSLASAYDVEIDVQTGAVKFAGIAPTAEKPPRAKQGDHRLFNVIFKKGDTVLDMGTPTSLQFGVRQTADDPLVVLSGGAPTSGDGTVVKKNGSGTTTSYYLYVDFSTADLAALLPDLAEGEALQCEFTYSGTNPTSSDRVGPANLTVSSLTHPFLIERELVTT